MENTLILKAENLSKHYGAKKAVDSVSLTIHKGDIYGFVGLNGSGKTTFIRLVTSLIKPTSGSFTLFGSDKNVNSLKRISSMVETPSIYLDKSAMDNVKIQCDLMGIKDSKEPLRLLELVGLDPVSKKVAKAFSLGMKQRLGIAVALVGNPQFMLLDEPTNGLDPEGIIEIRELLLKMNHDLGITILISSHILSELSKLATRFGFIHHGRIIKEATREEIAASVTLKIVLAVDDQQKAGKLLDGKCRYSFDGSNIVIFDDAPISDIVTYMAAGGVKVFSANKTMQDLEGYFINLIGGNNRR